MSRLLAYVRDTRAELKNANWPSGRQTAAYTALVVGISVVIAAYLAVFDAASIAGLNALIS